MRIEAGPEHKLLPIVDMAPEHVEVDRPTDHCGVGAMWDPDNSHLVDDMLVVAEKIQHRGEGGAGAAGISPSREGIDYIRGSGKVFQVFGEDGSGLRKALAADTAAAIVHTRWPTSKGEGNRDQPRNASELSLGHNGQLIKTERLARSFGVEEDEYTSDTDLVTIIFNKVAKHFDGNVEKAAAYVAPHLEGAFCITILSRNKNGKPQLNILRDRNGLRPLQIGTTETGGYIFASENMAIDNVPGARWEREVAPGELITIDEDGMRTVQWAEPEPAACLLEYVYLANKDTMLNGKRIGDARRGFGKEVVKRIPPHLLGRISMFIPLPNGANQATRGMAEATKIPYVPALKLNDKLVYSRSFIQVDQDAQYGAAGDKLVEDPEYAPQVEGEVVGIGEDSVVRSTTLRSNVPKIKRLKPAETHIIVASPQYTGTCNLGVDTPDPSKLIAVQMGGDEKLIADELEVNSITYAELADMYAVVGKGVCSACFGGKKPRFIEAAEADTSTKKEIGIFALAGAAA